MDKIYPVKPLTVCILSIKWKSIKTGDVVFKPEPFVRLALILFSFGTLLAFWLAKSL